MLEEPGKRISGVKGHLIMQIPDFQSLMLPVLQASANGEVRFADVVERLAEQLGLTPEARAELLPSGKQTVFNNRVHWAKTYLAKAGLLESTRRGHFKITPRGEQVVASHPDRIDISFLNQFEEFKQFREKSSHVGNQGEETLEPGLATQKQTPDEIMRVAHKQIEDSLAQELLESLLEFAPDFFERLIVNLLLSMGYGGSAVGAAGRSAGAETTVLMG